MVIILLVLAPVAVVLTLSDVRTTFLVYHLGLCILLPLLLSLGAGVSLRGHLRIVGLVDRSRGSVREGLITGLVLGGGTVGFFVLAGDTMLSPDRVSGAVAGWGIVPGEDTWLIAFMLLVNGPAEELFWRGWIHGRLAGMRSRPAALIPATAGYASYHWVTLHALLPSDGAAVLAFAGVVMAGAWWAWRRERRGDAWAPLLGHAGATAGYMIVYVVYVA